MLKVLLSRKWIGTLDLVYSNATETVATWFRRRMLQCQESIRVKQLMWSDLPRLISIWKCWLNLESSHTRRWLERWKVTKPDWNANLKEIRSRQSGKIIFRTPSTFLRWMRSGKPIEDFSKFILSPRGETLMIPKASRSDAGDYSCVLSNKAGSVEAPFIVVVQTGPHIGEFI